MTRSRTAFRLNTPRDCSAVCAAKTRAVQDTAICLDLLRPEVAMDRHLASSSLLLFEPFFRVSFPCFFFVTLSLSIKLLHLFKSPFPLLYVSLSCSMPIPRLMASNISPAHAPNTRQHHQIKKNTHTPTLNTMVSNAFNIRDYITHDPQVAA